MLRSPYDPHGDSDSLKQEDFEQLEHLMRPSFRDLITEITYNEQWSDWKESERTRMIPTEFIAADIRELGLSKRTITELNKIDIYTIADLQSTRRSTLRNLKFFGTKAITEITSALMKRDLHLASDMIYICDRCSARFADEISLQKSHICPVCQAKLDRLDEISEISVSLSAPEYSSYTAIGDGFALYANITNASYEIKKIRICDFYIVADGQQRSPEYFLTGYTFSEETIIPMTSRSCAKIWSNRVMKKDKLSVSDYAIISLGVSTQKHIFKFVFNGEAWDLDDYYKN